MNRATLTTGKCGNFPLSGRQKPESSLSQTPVGCSCAGAQTQTHTVTLKPRWVGDAVRLPHTEVLIAWRGWWRHVDFKGFGGGHSTWSGGGHQVSTRAASEAQVDVVWSREAQTPESGAPGDELSECSTILYKNRVWLNQSRVNFRGVWIQNGTATLDNSFSFLLKLNIVLP